MSGVIGKMFDVFRKLKQTSASVDPLMQLTSEKIIERLGRRPTGNEFKRAASPSQSVPIHVAAEVTTTLGHERKLAAAGAPHAIEQHCDEDLRHEVDLRGNPADKARFDTVPEVPATEAAFVLNSGPVAAEEICRADNESAPPAVEDPALEQQIVRTAPEARPSEEILAEFHALMHQHFGTGQPKADPIFPNVLQILRLDKGEVISTAPSVLALVPAPSEDVALAHPEPQVAIEMPQAEVAPLEVEEQIFEAPCEAEIIDDFVVIADEAQAIGNVITPPAWCNRTVGEVILESRCSVRLANCIAANEDFFSKWTIGEALSHRAEFRAVLLQVRSLGRKTASEALSALDAFVLDPGAQDGRSDATGFKQVHVDPLAAFDQARLNAPITTALSRHHTSVRLASLLATADLDDLTVRDFILQPDRIRARMMGRKNAGRRTMSEAFELLAAHVEALDQPDVETPSIQSKDEPPEGLTTREWVEREVSALLGTRAEVLHDRYGLDGQQPLTLQEIAKRVHVTRERVRQVEAKAIKRLRAEARSRAAFSRYLAEERDTQWDTLFGPHSNLPEDKVTEQFRRVNPWFLLAIDVAFENGIDGYLESNAVLTTDGWFRTCEDAEEHRKLDGLVSELLRAYQTPMPLDTLEEIAPAITTFVTKASDKWAVHNGYLFTGRIGSKARRTGHMHAVARRIARLGMFDIGTLIIEYRAEFPEDECGSRMFELQASEAPHLFLPLFDGIWLCLDHNSKHVGRLPAPPFERRCIEETHFAEGSLGDLLFSRLKWCGPQRAIDLRRTITETTHGSYSESSVGAVLLSNPCFRRAAPGIFGVYAGEAEDIASIDTLILEDRHCRLYCHARHSGAPQHYYPLWGAAYEMRLALWAQRHAPPELYRSLLTIIEPGSWPASSEIVAEFQSLQRQCGDWQIGAGRRAPLGHRFLDSGQFLSALTHLVLFGWISWVGINRATGSKPDAHDAADVMAFFIMSGLVEPEADWQAPHLPTDIAHRLFLEARRERHLHGDESSGDADVFSRLRSALYAAPPTASRGWVQSDEFLIAMTAWQADDIWMGKAFGGAQPRQLGINAEESFGSDDWSAVFRA